MPTRTKFPSVAGLIIPGAVIPLTVNDKEQSQVIYKILEVTKGKKGKPSIATYTINGQLQTPVRVDALESTIDFMQEALANVHSN